jgi:hypothetical protein
MSVAIGSDSPNLQNVGGVSDEQQKVNAQKEDEKKAELKRNAQKDKEREEASLNPVDRAALGAQTNALGEAIAMSIIGSVLG